MTRPLKRFLTAAFLITMSVAAHAQPSALIQQEVLLAYLDQLTQWQRGLSGLEPTALNAREVVFRDSLRENSAHALQSGFNFVRSVASDAPKTETVDPSGNRAKLMAAKADIESKLASASGDEARLLSARLELVNTILANMNSNSNKSPNKLNYTLDSLARSIPELGGKAPPSEPAPKQAEKKRTAVGILGLGSEWFEVARKQREVDDAISDTTSLKDKSMELMKTLRSGLGDPATGEEEGEQKEKVSDEPASPPMSVEARVRAYNEIGKSIVPLAESMRWMDASRQTLKEWRGVLEQRGNDVLGQLGVRLGVLILMLFVVYLVSDAVRRSLKRLRDDKRKRQLNNIRRILAGVAMVLIIILNFISDFGSFATFAGFLTAGLAVALQSVLLSLVAHFLFYGRYGIRQGDRVHVNGVTGDIMSIGMVRFYMRELEETKGGELKPTGKTVAFPNSIIFQNVAFYKYA